MIADLILAAWLGWCAWNVLILLVGPFLCPSPCTNGLWIRMPADFCAQLTAEEVAAVRAHEEGHRARLHVLRNLVRRCFLIPEHRSRFERHEHEADDYAAARGHGLALARVLQRSARTPFDRARARRLLELELFR